MFSQIYNVSSGNSFIFHFFSPPVSKIEIVLGGFYPLMLCMSF